MVKPTSRLQRFRESLRAVLDESIFRSGGELSRLHKFIHFWVLVGRSFVRNRCPIRASALSYTTLLALIPLFAVAISVTSSLLKKEGEDQVYHFVDRMVSSLMPSAAPGTNAVAPWPETNSVGALSTNGPGPGVVAVESPATISTNDVVAQLARSPDGTNAPSVFRAETRLSTAQRQAARQINEFIQNTRSGTLGALGMLVLVYIAIQMLASIEETFNDIWGVTRGRSWLVRIVLYWTTITLGPLLLAGALGLASGAHFRDTELLVSHLPGGRYLFDLLPLLVVCVTFILFYQLVPNTKVNFSAAVVGGLIGGTAWHLNNVFGFLYVSRVVTNSKIYGSLGLVPVLMIGLYLSWVILLFGAQVAYAFQNRKVYLQEKLAENVNQRGREFVSLRLMTCIGQRFQRGLPPVTIREMSEELGVPSRLVQQVLHTLIAAHLIVEISRAEPAYIPARPLESINAHHVLMAMRATHGQELVTRDEPAREEVYGEFARIQEAEKQVASAVTMLALVNRAQARLEIAPPPTAGEEIKPALRPDLESKAQPARPLVQTSSPPSAPKSPEAKTAAAAEPAGAKPEPARQSRHLETVAGPSTDDERNFPL